MCKFSGRLLTINDIKRKKSSESPFKTTKEYFKVVLFSQLLQIVGAAICKDTSLLVLPEINKSKMLITCENSSSFFRLLDYKKYSFYFFIGNV